MNFETDKLRIDFYSGAHGNFLEYILNRFVFNIESAKTIVSPFTTLGSSHIKNSNKAYLEDRIAIASHYSSYPILYKNGQKLPPNDYIVRIEVDNFYPIIYNSEVRGADIELDLENFSNLKYDKFSDLRKTIIEQAGKVENIPRFITRNIYYAKIMEKKFGVNIMNDWILDDHLIYNMPSSSFYSYIEFVQQLGLISKFVGIEFTVDYTPSSLLDIHKEFLEKNQGYQSMVKCNAIIESILTNKDCDINCNVLEEAYINSYLSTTFEIYEGECFGNLYPKNAQEIYKLIKLDGERRRKLM